MKIIKMILLLFSNKSTLHITCVCFKIGFDCNVAYLDPIFKKLKLLSKEL